MAEDARREPGADALDLWGMGPVHGASSGGRGWWQGEALSAAEVMTTGVATVARTQPVVQIAELMRRESVGVVAVVDAEQCLVGIVTDRDIVVRGCASSRPLAEQTAADVMTTDVVCARPDDKLARVVDRMAARGVRRLPVTDPAHKRGGKIVGIVSLDDVAAHAPEDLELAAALERMAEQRRSQTANSLAVAPHRRSFFPALWRRLCG
jgi:CBS domain-containing protein